MLEIIKNQFIGKITIEPTCALSPSYECTKNWKNIEKVSIGSKFQYFKQIMNLWIWRLFWLLEFKTAIKTWLKIRIF